MAARAGAVLVAAVVVLAGASCGGDDDGGGEQAPTTTSTTREDAPTSTTEAETTTTPTTEVSLEPPANTGTDMVAVLQSLSDFGNRLGMSPDPELVDLAYEPGLPPNQGLRSIMQDLAARGWRWSGPTEQLREIQDTGAVDARSWSLTAIVAPVVGSVLIDADGTPVPEQPPPLPTQRYVIQLLRGADDRWRIADLEPLGGPIG